MSGRIDCFPSEQWLLAQHENAVFVRSWGGGGRYWVLVSCLSSPRLSFFFEGLSVNTGARQTGLQKISADTNFVEVRLGSPLRPVSLSPSYTEYAVRSGPFRRLAFLSNAALFRLALARTHTHPHADRPNGVIWLGTGARWFREQAEMVS